jgi:hypothetical protein
VEQLQGTSDMLLMSVRDGSAQHMLVMEAGGSKGIIEALSLLRVAAEQVGTGGDQVPRDTPTQHLHKTPPGRGGPLAVGCTAVCQHARMHAPAAECCLPLRSPGLQGVLALLGASSVLQAGGLGLPAANRGLPQPQPHAPLPQPQPPQPLPPALHAYTLRALDSCASEAHRQLMREEIAKSVQEALTDGTLWTIDWATEPLPDIWAQAAALASQDMISAGKSVAGSEELQAKDQQAANGELLLAMNGNSSAWSPAGSDSSKTSFPQHPDGSHAAAIDSKQPSDGVAVSGLPATSQHDVDTLLASITGGMAALLQQQPPAAVVQPLPALPGAEMLADGVAPTMELAQLLLPTAADGLAARPVLLGGPVSLADLAAVGAAARAVAAAPHVSLQLQVSEDGRVAAVLAVQEVAAAGADGTPLPAPSADAAAEAAPPVHSELLAGGADAAVVAAAKAAANAAVARKAAMLPSTKVTEAAMALSKQLGDSVPFEVLLDAVQKLTPGQLKGIATPSKAMAATGVPDGMAGGYASASVTQPSSGRASPAMSSGSSKSGVLAMAPHIPASGPPAATPLTMHSAAAQVLQQQQLQQQQQAAMQRQINKQMARQRANGAVPVVQYANPGYAPQPVVLRPGMRPMQVSWQQLSRMAASEVARDSSQLPWATCAPSCSPCQQHLRLCCLIVTRDAWLACTGSQQGWRRPACTHVLDYRQRCAPAGRRRAAGDGAATPGAAHAAGGARPWRHGHAAAGQHGGQRHAGTLLAVLRISCTVALKAAGLHNATAAQSAAPSAPHALSTERGARSHAWLHVLVGWWVPGGRPS